MFKTFNIRLVIKTLGALILIETLFMAIATAVSWYYSDPDRDCWVISTLLTFSVGGWGLLFGRSAREHVSEREGYVIVAAVWLVCSALGLLPYYMSGEIPLLTDAWFEALSGFTTTGATILDDVEVLSHGSHLWRCMTQWLGGMGIIALSIAILPMFGLGGMQLYSAEMNGLSYEKLSPRIADTAKHLWVTYILLTIFCGWCYRMEGMSTFDSICHGFTTIATGGFSTKNASLAYYSNPLIHYTAATFMMLSGLNYGLLILLFRGKPGRLFRDEETRWYLLGVALVTLVLTAGLTWMRRAGLVDMWSWGLFGRTVEQAFREGYFTTVAIMTSAGFAIADYTTWYEAMAVLVFFLMFFGASSGSTSGGIKWIRIIIFGKSGLAEVNRRIHPHAIVPVKINGKPISQQTTNNVMAFMVFYINILLVAILLFCAMGVDFKDSLGAAVSAMGNIGPAIGSYGPSATFSSFPTAGKWLLTLLMLIGRLEIFTIILLFTKALWRK